jgi:hypothetical protein
MIRVGDLAARLRDLPPDAKVAVGVLIVYDMPGDVPPVMVVQSNELIIPASSRTRKRGRNVEG